MQKVLCIQLHVILLDNGASISSGEFSSKFGTKASATEAILVMPALYF
jgi:hypothetical protein